MSISETLDTLRQSHAGCKVAAFADLTSRIVLRASAETTPRQEVLSVLAAAAHNTLASDLAEMAQAATGSETRIDTAFVLRQNSAQVFVAASANASDALLFDAGGETDLEALAEAGRIALNAQGNVT